jgi:hypothetical protein
MFSASRGRLRKGGNNFRSRQVTGCIDGLRRNDLVKEISQTCNRSATVRLARDLE